MECEPGLAGLRPVIYLSSPLCDCERAAIERTADWVASHKGVCEGRIWSGSLWLVDCRIAIFSLSLKIVFLLCVSM
jgi:hypothetical protein